MNSFDIEKRIADEELREDLKKQAEDAEQKLADELRRIEEENQKALDREKQREKDLIRLKEAEDLDAWNTAREIIRLRKIKEDYELREAMKKDAEEAFENKEPPVDPDDGERDPDLNITETDNTQEQERAEEEKQKRAAEEAAKVAAEEAEEERLKAIKMLEEQERINQEEKEEHEKAEKERIEREDQERQEKEQEEEARKIAEAAMLQYKENER